MNYYLAPNTTTMAPPTLSLTRKRSWTEMSVLHATQKLSVPSQPMLIKKNKSVLGSMAVDEMECCPCAGTCTVCAEFPCELSEDTQRFLMENPMDELPHPVLRRQHAIQDTNDRFNCVNMSILEPQLDSDDDEMIGEGLASVLPERKCILRWNTSIVGSSLARPSCMPSLRRM